MAANKPIGQLKQKLIQKALEKKLKHAEQRAARPAAAVRRASDVPDEFCRFADHPGYSQVRLIRDGASQLGLSNPFFRVHEGTAGATTIIDGRECINFASYNYLGLSGHPQVNQAAIDAVNRYGTSVSASRMVSGERPVHRQLETAIAAAYEVDDAVAFVSGHATNVSTIGYLFGKRDLILHDEWIHNSSLIGAQLAGAKRMAYPHNDADALDHLLEQHRHKFERILIITEGLFSMDGDFPDLPGFIEVKRRHKAFLMVDEAHSFGVLGKTGRGIREHFGIEGRDVDIWMGTFSKTLAGCGGFIAGESALTEHLRHLAPGFLYSVGMPAQVAAPSLAALNVMLSEPERIEKLNQNSKAFIGRARELGLNTGSSKGIAIVPVITGSSIDATERSQALFNEGINVQPIVYPAVPEKSARLRFFLSSDHTPTQIDRTLAALASIS